jgi:hypothetical protein
MGAGLLAVKSGFILFIKNYQFPLQINTLERERPWKKEVLAQVAQVCPRLVLAQVAKVRPRLDIKGTALLSMAW